MGGCCVGLGRHKGKERHTKNCWKINEGDSFLSSSLDISSRPHCRSWAREWLEVMTEPWQWELAYKRQTFLEGFWVGGTFCSFLPAGDPGSDPSASSGILGLLVSVTQPYVEPRVGDTSPSSSTSGPVELRSTGYLVQWQGINLLLGVSPAKASSYYTRLSCAGG